MSVFFSDPQQYHVGDQVVPGWPSTVGRVWSESFHLPYDPGEASLLIDVQDTQAVHNEVKVNGINVGHLLRNPKREYVTSRHRIPHGVLRIGTNSIEIQAGIEDEHHGNYDDILIRNIRVVAEQESGGGHFEPSFWHSMGIALSAKSWRLESIPGFPLAMVKSGWVLAMIDGHVKNAAGALAELDDYANRMNLPSYRLLVVVFKRAPQQEIQPILEKYLGDRMEKQTVGSVIHLASCEFYPPKIPGWSFWTGHLGHPSFDDSVGQDIRDALKKALGPQ